MPAINLRLSQILSAFLGGSLQSICESIVDVMASAHLIACDLDCRCLEGEGSSLVHGKVQVGALNDNVRCNQQVFVDIDELRYGNREQARGRAQQDTEHSVTVGVSP